MKHLAKLIILVFSVTAQAGPLKVYKSDGVTIVGNYVGCSDSRNDQSPIGCTDRNIKVAYSNTSTGAVSIITENDIAENQIIYYTGTSCTSWKVAVNASAAGNYCDGVACIHTNGGYYNVNWASYRQNGTCYNTPGSGVRMGGEGYSGSSISTPLCGLNGACLIKP